MIFLLLLLSVGPSEHFNLSKDLPSPKDIYIKDTDDLFPDTDKLATLKNIKKYKNIDLYDKVVKMLFFDKSAFIIEFNEEEPYTILINIESLNTSVNQTVVYNTTNDGKLVYKIYIFNGSLYLQYNKQTVKFSSNLNANRNYPLVINKSPRKITVFFDEIQKDINSTTNLTGDKIILGSIYNNHKIMNPFQGYIGNINIYKELITTKDLFNNRNISGNIVKKNVEICKFLPEGYNVKSCVSKCQKNNGCDVNYCTKICEKCIDYNKCKWVKEPKIEPKASPPKPDIPYPPKINCYAGDSNIEIRFKKPFDNYNPISKYLIKCVKSYKNNGFTKIATFDSIECGKNSCRYILHGLDNKEYYNISVQAVNSIGISRSSNEETIAPNGELSPKKISSALIESDDEIKKEVLKKFNYDNTYCDATSFANYDEHLLDTIDDKYDIEMFIKNEYLKKEYNN